MVYEIFKNPFYYGEFEYPTGSGNWYQGQHQPLIDKELFEEVRKRLVAPLKPKWGAKSFPFKQFLKCAGCGSAVVGEEKFKKRKDGGMNRHVYYHCSRQVSYECKEPYVKEPLIIQGLIEMRNELLTDLSGIEPGLSQAIDKYIAIIRSTEAGTQNFIPGYIKYVLEQGSDFEKTRLVRNLNIKLALSDRRLVEVL